MAELERMEMEIKFDRSRYRVEHLEYMAKQNAGRADAYDTFKFQVSALATMAWDSEEGDYRDMYSAEFELMKMLEDDFHALWKEFTKQAIEEQDERNIKELFTINKNEQN